jgi:uncharacterized membrane protein
MENQNKLWRAFFAAGLMAIAIQQFPWHDFRPVILPPGYPAWLEHRFIWACIFSIALIAACAAILFNIKARSIALLLAGVFFTMVLLFQVPSLIFGPNSFHLGSWTDPFKELTLSGGAFIIAGSLPHQNNTSGLTRFLERFIPFGKYFFAFTMALFGFMHFVYADFVATLVPNWIPWHLFWTYLAGAALIAGGLGVMLNIKRQLAAKLLGIIIFIWLIVLHIPRGIAYPLTANGNEWTSVFEALAFSGIGFLIAGKPDKKFF